LVQNAIDTSRHRRYVERARGHARFQPAPIRVAQWRDREGRLWVRFDDCGMGMDEPIIRDHLLKVGSSYYTTPQFRADVLAAKGKSDASDFLPISRFGIGLLSCFIAVFKPTDEWSQITQVFGQDGCLGTTTSENLRELDWYSCSRSPAASRGSPSRERSTSPAPNARSLPADRQRLASLTRHPPAALAPQITSATDRVMDDVGRGGEIPVSHRICCSQHGAGPRDRTRKNEYLKLGQYHACLHVLCFPSPSRFIPVPMHRKPLILDARCDMIIVD